MSFRIERINAEMQKSISDIVANRIKDPRVGGMISVIKVDTAKDLKTAKVYVSIYGDKHSAADTFGALKNCAGYIKKELSADFRDLRVVPTLTFILDDSMEYSEKIDAIIQGIKSGDEKNDNGNRN